MKSIKAKIITFIFLCISLLLMVTYDSIFNTLPQEVAIEELELALSKEDFLNKIQRAKKSVYVPKNLSLTDTNQNTFLVFDENLRKSQIINFWASWCAPCLKELPSLFKLAHEYKDTVRVLAISVDENEASFNKVVSKLRNNYSNSNAIIIARDTSKTAAKIFNTKKVPETFLVKSNGEISGKVVGYVDWQLAPISEYIDITP